MAELSERSITRMDMVMDDLYGTEGATISRGRIVEAAQNGGVGDDLMFYVTELHDGDYSRRQLDEAINGMIDLYGDQGHVT